MISVTVEKASRTLPKIIRDTLRNCEETIIVSDDGSVVLIDQAEWERMRETMKLLCDEKSLKALLEGHKDRDEGRRPESVRVDEAFYDL